MKEHLKRMDIAAGILTLYVCVVWFAYLFLNVTTKKSYLLAMMILIAVVSYLVLKWGTERIRKIPCSENTDLKRTEKIQIFTVSAAITLAVMLLYFLAYSPGSFSWDSITQFEQVITGKYNDWHPVWHTFLFFTIPYKLFGKPSAIVILQLLYFSLLMGYLSITICEICSKKAAAVTLAYLFC